ncbi:uracil-DNA glycosylase [soil metagenome]|nr:uracil-DNA glycosylase [Trueperaceae bacterium]
MSLDELEHAAAAKPDALHGLSDSLVFGEGDPDADLMLVGEAPGEEEDRSGRPFVGRAGQLLDRILDSVDIDRADVYITNMVKFRPPGNRAPTAEELSASLPILREQIRLVRPQIIATLGNVPTQWFLATKEGITKRRGRWHEWQGVRVFPLYHPAYLLRNPSRERGSPKWETWQDMQTLKAALVALDAKSGPLVIDTAEQSVLF